jgi:hypothetical protein
MRARLSGGAGDMDAAGLWGYAHILLFVFWLGTDLGVFFATALVKNPARSFETRKTLIRVAHMAHVLPRICFALIIPTGVELTRAINVYPLTPGLQSAGWGIAALWLALIFASVKWRGTPLAANLRIIEIVFEAFMGLAFVAYGLNSLATGAPIDDPWFAAKLFLFGLVFWAAIAVDIGFRPFYAPFYEIAQEGSTPEREEAISAAANHALVGMAAVYLLVAAIAFIGKVKPF